MNTIISDIRDAHRRDTTTADEGTLATKLAQDIKEAMSFKGSDEERQIKILCGQLGIPYDKLTQDEFAGLMSALQKSKVLKSQKGLRGKGSMTHGKGKRKHK